MEKLVAGDPQRIGAYRLLARLGAGGMGQVYLARSDRGRTVAVKLVRKELAEQDEFRSRFRLEVAAARRVGGAWTAPVLDANTEAPVPWVATGYVAGPSLQDIVSGPHGPLPARSVRILASGLAHALQDIHAAGLIHRDLKPSNVLVTIEGPRVIDFGIARALETVTDGEPTRTGLVGSPGFMAPEQMRGEQITPACDVFCLGSVLAFAATGQLPFGTAGTAAPVLMYRVAQEEPNLSQLPPELRELVGHCLKKDPKDRPTPAQLVSGLGRPDGEPWLPGALLAQLGSDAVQLLEHEEPGSRTELSFAKPAPAPTPVPTPAPIPAQVPTATPAPAPPPGVHGMTTTLGAPPTHQQPPQPQPQHPYGPPQQPQQPHPQPQQPLPPHQYGYPQPGQRPLPPWGSAPPFSPPPSPYGPTPAYGPAQGAPPEPPRRTTRGTVALVAVALLVALGAGGSVYAFMDSGSEKTRSSPATPDDTPPATESPSPSPTPSKTPDAAGSVPKEYLGTWSGTISGPAGLSTRELTVRQGEVGDTVLVLTAEGPTDTGGRYRCVFEAPLDDPADSGPLKIGPSTVTKGEPKSSCTPGAATELTILDDDRLRRVTTADGESVTYSKSD